MDADAIPIHAYPEYPDAVCSSVCITTAHACPYCGADISLPDPLRPRRLEGGMAAPDANGRAGTRIEDAAGRDADLARRNAG